MTSFPLTLSIRSLNQVVPVCDSKLAQTHCEVFRGNDQPLLVDQ